MNTLLLVDDNKNMRLMLRENLQKHDFLVIEASHGKRVLEILDRHEIDLILLDVRLPDGNCCDFFSDIRMRTHAPVIMMSGDRDKNSALKGFKAGADDYLGKPFHPDILVAKVRAILKRNSSDIPTLDYTMKSVRFQDWVLDRSQFQIYNHEGQSGNLTALEFALLDVLITRAGSAVKRDELCEAARQDNYIPTPRAIDVKITRIRKKLGDSGTDPKFINTIRGIGYMFDANTISPKL